MSEKLGTCPPPPLPTSKIFDFLEKIARKNPEFLAVEDKYGKINLKDFLDLVLKIQKFIFEKIIEKKLEKLGSIQEILGKNGGRWDEKIEKNMKKIILGVSIARSKYFFAFFVACSNLKIQFLPLPTPVVEREDSQDKYGKETEKKEETNENLKNEKNERKGTSVSQSFLDKLIADVEEANKNQILSASLLLSPHFIFFEGKLESWWNREVSEEIEKKENAYLVPLHLEELFGRKGEGGGKEEGRREEGGREEGGREEGGGKEEGRREEGGREEGGREEGGEEECVLAHVFTGGTTSQAKCVQITERMFMHELKNYRKLFKNFDFGIEDEEIAQKNPKKSEKIEKKSRKILKNPRVFQGSSPLWGAALLGQVSLAWGLGGALVVGEDRDMLKVDLSPLLPPLHLQVLPLVPSQFEAISQISSLESVEIFVSWADKLEPKTKNKIVHFLEKNRKKSEKNHEKLEKNPANSVKVEFFELLISSESWLSLGGEGEPGVFGLLCPGVQLGIMEEKGEKNTIFLSDFVENEEFFSGKSFGKLNFSKKSEKNKNILGKRGELILGGPQLTSLGYFGKPEINEKKFVFFEKNTEKTRKKSEKTPEKVKFFLTGDVVEIVPEGIKFLGRNDVLGKSSGKWIDISEIEKKILKIENVKECKILKNFEKSEQKNDFFCALSLEKKSENSGFFPNFSEKFSKIRNFLPKNSKILFFSEVPKVPSTGKIDLKKINNLFLEKYNSLKIGKIKKSEELRKSFCFFVFFTSFLLFFIFLRFPLGFFFSSIFHHFSLENNFLRIFSNFFWKKFGLCRVDPWIQRFFHFFLFFFTIFSENVLENCFWNLQNVFSIFLSIFLIFYFFKNFVKNFNFFCVFLFFGFASEIEFFWHPLRWEIFDFLNFLNFFYFSKNSSEKNGNICENSDKKLEKNSEKFEKNSEKFEKNSENSEKKLERIEENLERFWYPSDNFFRISPPTSGWGGWEAAPEDWIYAEEGGGEGGDEEVEEVEEGEEIDGLNDFEKKILDMFLEIAEVSEKSLRKSSFFSDFLDSIKSVQMSSKLQEIGIQMSVAEILDCRFFEDFFDKIRKKIDEKKEKKGEIEDFLGSPVNEKSSKNSFFPNFFSIFSEKTSDYSSKKLMSWGWHNPCFWAFQLKNSEKWDEKILKKTFFLLAKKHDSLRTNVDISEGLNNFFNVFCGFLLIFKRFIFEKFEYFRGIEEQEEAEKIKKIFCKFLKFFFYYFLIFLDFLSSATFSVWPKSFVLDPQKNEKIWKLIPEVQKNYFLESDEEIKEIVSDLRRNYVPNLELQIITIKKKNFKEYEKFKKNEKNEKNEKTNREMLLVGISHAVSDGFSILPLLKDFRSFYKILKEIEKKSEKVGKNEKEFYKDELFFSELRENLPPFFLKKIPENENWSSIAEKRFFETLRNFSGFLKNEEMFMEYFAEDLFWENSKKNNFFMNSFWKVQNFPESIFHFFSRKNKKNEKKKLEKAEREEISTLARHVVFKKSFVQKLKKIKKSLKNCSIEIIWIFLISISALRVQNKKIQFLKKLLKLEKNQKVNFFEDLPPYLSPKNEFFDFFHEFSFKKLKDFANFDPSALLLVVPMRDSPPSSSSLIGLFTDFRFFKIPLLEKKNNSKIEILRIEKGDLEKKTQIFSDLFLSENNSKKSEKIDNSPENPLFFEDYSPFFEGSNLSILGFLLEISEKVRGRAWSVPQAFSPREHTMLNVISMQRQGEGGEERSEEAGCKEVEYEEESEIVEFSDVQGKERCSQWTRRPLDLFLVEIGEEKWELKMKINSELGLSEEDAIELLKEIKINLDDLLKNPNRRIFEN